MKRVLFISYFFKPFTGVGAKRVTYWAENINKCDSNIKCDVITAINPENCKYNNIENVYYIPNSKKTNLMSFIIKDEGLTWIADLKAFFKNHLLDKYDCIIISGGPFMHFSIGKFLKKKYGAKIIIDFRDPFAANPRFSNGAIKVLVKRYFENKFIKNSDAFLTVNQFCSNIIGTVSKEKNYIIENGYDENIIKVIKDKTNYIQQNDIIKLSYIGTIYPDFNITNFFDVISTDRFKNKFSFSYAGKSEFKEYEDSNIYNYGLMNYEDALNLINKSQIGLIFTGGKAFESTTKIFEYIGLDKVILIITDGEIKTGNLYNITKNISHVYWCKNNKDSIGKTLMKIESSQFNICRTEKTDYSRAEGLKKLMKLINKLTLG